MKKKLILWLMLALSCMILSLFPEERGIMIVKKEKRLALVIGNNDYSPGKLKNAVNDASAMRDILEQLGFEVLYEKNSNLREMKETIQDFFIK